MNQRWRSCRHVFLPSLLDLSHFPLNRLQMKLLLCDSSSSEVESMENEVGVGEAKLFLLDSLRQCFFLYCGTSSEREGRRTVVITVTIIVVVREKKTRVCGGEMSHFQSWGWGELSLFKTLGQREGAGEGWGEEMK